MNSADPAMSESLTLAAVSCAGVSASCGINEACVEQVIVTPHRPTAARTATSRNGHANAMPMPAAPVPARATGRRPPGPGAAGSGRPGWR